MVIDSGALVDADAARRAMTDLAPALDETTPSGVVPERETEELGSLDEAERKHIVAVLQATAGNQTQAAFILGIERKTLARKIKRYNITAEEAPL